MDVERRRRIFDRTMGRCHICGKNLVFSHYGAKVRDQPRAWEIEHSVPRARNGTDRLNNLYPAHVACNRRKGTCSSRSARRPHGRIRAPMSEVQRERVRSERMTGGAVAGGFIGARIGGVPGALIGAAIGALVSDGDPEED